MHVGVIVDELSQEADLFQLTVLQAQSHEVFVSFGRYGRTNFLDLFFCILNSYLLAILSRPAGVEAFRFYLIFIELPWRP